MRVRCPFCGKEFEDLSAMPGSVVTCPFCLKQARLLGEKPVKTGLEQKPTGREYIPPRPAYSPVKKGFSTSMVGIILIVGVVIFFVGAILCNSAVMTETPSDYKEAKEAREDARLIY